MASAVQGKDCIFQVNITGGYKSLLCTKSFAINTTTDVVEITTISDGSDPETGIWRDYDHDAMGYTISLDGVMKITDVDNDTIWEMLAAQTGFIEVDWKATFIDAEANSKVVQGYAIVTASSLNVAPSSLVNHTIELIGKGKYTIT